MKRISSVLAVCCTLLLLHFSACSNQGQGQPQSSNNLETTQGEAANDNNIVQNNYVTQAELSDSEKEDIVRQSKCLQDAGIEGMTAKTADELAEYFIRCQRLDQTERPTTILKARHEICRTDSKYPPHWEYWVLTSSNGTEYWLEGFTHESFDVIFVCRDGPDGEILYGYYR